MKLRNILILTLVMAFITTILFNNYLNNLEEKYKKNENKISVVVPKIDITKNEKVTEEMLETKEFYLESVHPEAIKEIKDIVGKYAATNMKQGEILFSSRFVDQFAAEDFLTNKIREGYGAVSIEVNYVESVSNLIEPEDYVDVIFSEIIEKENETDEIITEVILENVRVLAVGKRLNENSPQIDSLDITSQSQIIEDTGVEYISVTLELRPEDMVKIVNADERGNVKFTLKSDIFPN
jgi:pilus assembly protein CpaB